MLKESGYEEALMGLSLSFKMREVPIDEWWTDEKLERMQKISPNLARKGAGHNKFLRQMVIWLDIEAPRYFWSEFDTYKVGTVAQSESTMHTLAKRSLTQQDMGCHVPQEILTGFNNNREYQGVRWLKAMLPEAYLQRRVVMLNYEVVNTILKQRSNHRLDEWQLLCGFFRKELQHQEYLYEEVIEC